MVMSFKWFAAGIVTTLSLLSIGCAVGKTSVSAATSGTDTTSSAVPVISKILPQSITVGAPSQAIKVMGTNFDDKAVIVWNGKNLTTSVLDASTLSSTVDSSAFTAPATVQLQVANSTGKQSNAVALTVAASTPATAPLSITTAALAAATSGVSYSQSLQATGGTPGYSWTITAGSLPAGLSFVPSAAMIVGTPTTSGTFPVTLTVTDTSSPALSQSVSLAITVSPSALAIATSSFASGSFGVPYAQPLQATGGTPNYNWTVSAGSLPPGLSLTPSAALIAGTPTAAGRFSFSVTATDSSNPVQAKAFSSSITISPSALSVKSSSFAAGITGTAYSQTLQAAGGTPGYTWSLTSGSLPAGISLVPSAGMLAGTPTVAGTFPITLSVSDSGTPAQTQTVSAAVVISPSSQLTITSSSLASATKALAYSQSLQAAGGTPPYSWAITGGTAPAGLTLASSGALAGMPVTPGNYPFTATVTDSSSPAQTKSVSTTVTVAPPALSITSSTLTAGTMGSAYAQTLQASGGTPAYSWRITSGSLPTGLNLSASGSISGLPTASGTFPITATVADTSSPALSKSVATSITIAPSTLSVTSSSLAAGTSGAAYSQALQATGGTTPYAWSVTSGSLPAGLTLAPSTGVISGTPTASGSSTFTATVLDSSSPAQTRTITLSLSVAPSALAVSSSSLAGGTSGTAYSQTLQATGGTTPYGWSVTSGSLPAGLSLAPSTGMISGTPTASGSSTFTATVSDKSSPVQTKSVSLTISVAPSTLALSSSSLAAGTSGTAYSQTLQATGGTTPYGWSVTSGSLPAGLTLAPSTGMISGTPTASGSATFTATVTDQSSPAQTKSVSLTITVAPSTLALSSSSLAAGTGGTAYSQTLQATGGTTPYGWTVTSGSLPAGLTLAPSTGVISGTPTASGSSTFTATVTDKSSPVQTKSVSLTITVAPSTLALSTSSLAAGTSGTAYSQTLQATGGTTPYGWSVTSGSLPAGLSLAPSTGVISGTPTASGSATFTAMVTDKSSPVQTKSVSLTITVAPSTLALSTSSMASGTSGTAYSQTLQATGGTTPYGWSVSSGSLPAGLTLAPSTGVISGTPTASGSATFTATVTDKSSPVQTKSVSLTITVAPSTLAISTSSMAAGTSGTAYSQTLQATGGTTPYGWSVTSGSLPAGLTLAPSTGVISGTPTASGSSTFTATVTDKSSRAQAKSVSLTITVASTTLSISSSSLAAGTSGTAYSQTLQATGGTTPYGWSVTSGSLPAGLSLAASTGVISGTPTASGSSTFTATVTDKSSPAQTKSVSLSISVSPAALSIASSNLPSGTNGTAYASTMNANGGTPAYTWNYSGTLPAGLTLAATTGVISGTPTTDGTFSFTVTVTDNSTPSQSQSAATSITIAAVTTTPTGPGTTWYVRPDGGTRYSANMTSGQCDGKSDTAYGGVGTNQHCAFNDYRFLYDDQSYTANAWVISGGDTVILRGGPWRVGFDQGTSGADKWCVRGNGPYDCFNPGVPAGTATQHTRILGENFGSCNATNKTQIFGGFAVGVALNLGAAQYVDVSCLEITRHSDCIRHGYPAYPANCSSSFPLDDYDGSGIATSNGTHDLTLTDLWIHGHTDRGIIGSIGANVTCLRCNISYNGMAGWDFDDGSATPFGANASWNFLYSQIEWNGCNQEYPITHTFPAASCYSQSSGGYGDGIGTPANTGTGMSIVVDHSTFDHNTQDGIDLGHMDAGNNTLVFTNNYSYANSGGTVKWGAYFQTVTFNNNLLEANCLRMSAPIPGAPSTFNANLSDFCRAQDGVSFNFLQNGTATFANNTIVSYAPTTMDINCWSASCTNSTFTFENNIVVGYSNPTTYNMGGQSGGPGGFYYQAPIGNVVRNNNLYYGIRNINCPTGNTAETCTSPLFVNQPTWVDETSLDNFNFNLTPGSPAKGAGATLTFVPKDYNGATRGNPPSLGAIE